MSLGFNKPIGDRSEAVSFLGKLHVRAQTTEENLDPSPEDMANALKKSRSESTPETETPKGKENAGLGFAKLSQNKTLSQGLKNFSTTYRTFFTKPFKKTSSEPEKPVQLEEKLGKTNESLKTKIEEKIKSFSNKWWARMGEYQAFKANPSLTTYENLAKAFGKESSPSRIFFNIETSELKDLLTSSSNEWEEWNYDEEVDTEESVDLEREPL